MDRYWEIFEILVKDFNKCFMLKYFLRKIRKVSIFDENYIFCFVDVLFVNVLGFDEFEEWFILLIYKVFGNGIIDGLILNIIIIIVKYGFLNGVFVF